MFSKDSCTEYGYRYDMVPWSGVSSLISSLIWFRGIVIEFDLCSDVVP